jgi:hypothetical protein
MKISEPVSEDEPAAAKDAAAKAEAAKAEDAKAEDAKAEDAKDAAKAEATKAEATKDAAAKAEAKPPPKVEGAGSHHVGEYYYTSFPGFGRKGIAPGMRFGDPILNRENKFVYYNPCEENDNCWSEDSDEVYKKWKDMKQVAPSTDELMENQLQHAFRVATKNMDACKAAYTHDEEASDKCQHKEARKLCYSFVNLANVCDWTQESRVDSLTGTVYWDEAHELKACKSDAKKSMDDMCKKHTKLPGVSVSHWPWQDWKMNMVGKDTFSGDVVLGPEAWSGRYSNGAR